MTLDELKTLSTDHQACITGTLMVPLHQSTLAKIVACIEAADRMAWEPCHAPDQAAEVCAAYADARAALDSALKQTGQL